MKKATIRTWVILVALAAGVIGVAQVAFPTPDVSDKQLEVAVSRAFLRPDDRVIMRVKSVSCERATIWDSHEWDCDAGVGVTLFPDGTVRYRVSVRNDGCWQARAPKRADMPDSFSAFKHARLRGCI